MYIDNDAQVYLDGVLISTADYVQPTGGTSVIDPAYDGWVIHGGCPDGGANAEGALPAEEPSGYPLFIIANVAAGNHTIAVRAHDFGGSTYFDMKVTLVAPVPD
jgi:hypothetical protein